MVGCYGPLTEAQLLDLLSTGQYAFVGGPYATLEECETACGQSGGSGSGGSGSGITEGCPCDPLPLTLVLRTTTDPVHCAPWNDGEWALNYNPLTGDWISAPFRDPLGGTSTFTWTMICGGSSNPTYLVSLLSESGSIQAELTIISCDPLSLGAVVTGWTGCFLDGSPIPLNISIMDS
jgi:hypothetical protein